MHAQTERQWSNPMTKQQFGEWCRDRARAHLASAESMHCKTNELLRAGQAKASAVMGLIADRSGTLAEIAAYCDGKAAKYLATAKSYRKPCAIKSELIGGATAFMAAAEKARERTRAHKPLLMTRADADAIETMIYPEPDTRGLTAQEQQAELESAFSKVFEGDEPAVDHAEEE
jgi:hypothetical protein